jgi:2-polyprenyl-3-methyl-5-hydroxy-6-metoxy-1,4-benzoquinol methylase
LILDLGCGTGRGARELASAGFRVIAADMDFDAVATGRGLSGTDSIRPSFVVARAEAPPFRDASFDAVLCGDVLHWAADESAFTSMWEGAWKSLKPGGLFAVRCLLRDSLPSAFPLGGGRFRLASGAEWFLPARAELDALLARAGGQGGEWLAPPQADAHGAAGMVSRKSR